jgi:hypothetical protein
VQTYILPSGLDPFVLFHSPSSVAQYATPVVQVAGRLAFSPTPIPLDPVNDAVRR